MKHYCFKFFCFFFMLLTGIAFAGQNSLTTSYPAPQASYAQITLVNQSNAAGICGTPFSPQNNGAVFVDPASGMLETCVNGAAATSYQGCFNRFCSTKGTIASPLPPLCGSIPLPLACPAGNYAQAKSGGIKIKDTFITDSTTGSGINYHWTTSIVCCQTNPGGGSFDYPT